jgi:hypothetical protein
MREKSYSNDPTNRGKAASPPTSGLFLCVESAARMSGMSDEPNKPAPGARQPEPSCFGVAPYHGPLPASDKPKKSNGSLLAIVINGMSNEPDHTEAEPERDEYMRSIALSRKRAWGGDAFANASYCHFMRRLDEYAAGRLCSS